MGYLNSDGLETQIQYIKSYVQDEIKKHASMPIGHEYFSMNPNVPQGSLPLIGGVYSRATYADLWAWAQTQTGYCKTEAQWQALSTANNGNVPYYSDGDGSTTFRVPSLHCWIKGSDGSAQLVGSYLAAGLPNITGDSFTDTWGTGFTTNYAGEYFNGALYGTHSESNLVLVSPAGTSTGSDKYRGIGLDASRSNSIYGNANTVQPESIVGMWLVKAYGTIEDTGTIDEQAYIDDRFNASKQYTDTKLAGLQWHTWSGTLTTDGAGRINFTPNDPVPQELLSIPLNYHSVSAGQEYTALFTALIDNGLSTFTTTSPFVYNSDHWVITIYSESDFSKYVGSLAITLTWATAIK